MKKFSLLFLSTLMAVCLFTSCSDDDDDNDSIVGTWKVMNGTADVETTDDDATHEIKEEYTFTGGGATMEFKENGTVVTSGGDQASYSLKDGKIYISYDDDYYDDFTYNYSLSNGKLTLSYDAKVVDADYLVDLIEDGVTINKCIAYLHLEKK